MPVETPNQFSPLKPPHQYSGKKRRSGGHRTPIWVTAVLCVCLIATLGFGVVLALRVTAPAPAPTPIPPVATPIPTIAPTPVPTPAPVPVLPAVLDFTLPIPASPAVADDWFNDAVFIGDSRTDGLRLYSGIRGPDFLCYKGVTVFDMGTKKVIDHDGKKLTTLEALGLKQYAKVYIMLGVNELGWFNDQKFIDAYAALLDDIRALQPNAVLYVQSLVPVNPEKAAANNQPYYVTNEKIADYTALLTQLATEKRAVYVDVAAGLVDENGVLPAAGSTDGVHFTKEYYIKWYQYLKEHTAVPEAYWAGQGAGEGAIAP